MSTEQPTNGHWQSPPSWHTQTPQPTTALPSPESVEALAAAMHQPRQPRRRSGAGAWVAAITTTLGALALGFAGGVVAAPAETPASCLEALEYADELNEQSNQMAVYFAELSDISGRAIEAAVRWDVTELESLTAETEALTSDLEALSDEVDETYAAYETARDECRAEGGE